MHSFGPTTPPAFAWWADVPVQDARKTFDLIAGELLRVDLAGHDAWVLAADESALRSAGPIRGIRLQVASDLRLLGQDRARLFVGPGKNDDSPPQDWLHPNGLVVKGRIAGAWGPPRRQGEHQGGRPSGSVHPSSHSY